MTELFQLLKTHHRTHPAMTAQDAVKFLHQSFMGPGHLIPDEAFALARLEEEWAQLDASAAEKLCSPLGNQLYRLNLKNCKAIGLSTKTIAKLFFLTARDIAPKPDALEKSLSLVEDLFPTAETWDYLRRYRAEGCPMVSHSEAYRAAYSPAYRVISGTFVPLLSILAAIDRQTAGGGSVRVALDGPCASGKSTLGEALARIYDCPLFHMDDFFLQPEQRTPQRLEQPGGNVDYERFDREILTPLCAGEPVRFRPWRCRTASLGEAQTVSPSPIAIVEGSYSMRPELRDRYTLRVWVEAPWEVRLERLAQRGGEGCLQRYRTLWIPMEDKYFQHFQIKDCCHLTYFGHSD